MMMTDGLVVAFIFESLILSSVTIIDVDTRDPRSDTLNPFLAPCPHCTQERHSAKKNNTRTRASDYGRES